MLVITLTMIAACKKGPTDPEGETPMLPPTTATVLFLDDFDAENGGRGVYNWTTFQHWNVLEGCVDLHGNGFHDVQPGRSLYVDLDGTCENAGTIETKNAFDLPSGNYVLEFWLAGNQRVNRSDTVVVSLGTLFQERIILRQRDAFALFTRNIPVTTATSAKLRFQHHGGDDEGILLDLVRLRRAE